MNLPDPEDIAKMIQHAMEHGKSGMLFGGKMDSRDEEKCSKGQCDCQQVIDLKPEDKLHLKTLCSMSDGYKRKASRYLHEAAVLKEKNTNMWSKFWERVYSTYGLMSTNDYHWSDNGKIFKIKED